MADYTTAELLNEVSKIFRGGLSPGRDGGTLNTATEYQQLLEMSSITFLFNPDAVFYIARLAANQLNSTVIQEVALLEDILVALDDLSQIGAPVRDTTTLSNARTTVLSLDAAQSVTNRPETQRFTQQMDTFAAQLRKNLVSVERNGAFVRPREEARNLIQDNLLSLAQLHSTLLSRIFAVRDALKDFLTLDLPSKVSTSALAAVNSRLQSTIDELNTASNVNNLAANRRYFLEALANKIAVKILGTFTDPTEFKYRSPNRPIPSTVKHLGQVTGQGTAASVTTRAGPWVLPISAPLVLSVSGGAPISLSLDTIRGAVLTARNSEPYLITANNQHLHVIVDSAIIQTTVLYSGTTWFSSTSFLGLGFKHLGALVSFPDADDGINPNDLQTRYIADLMGLQSATAPNVSWASPTLTVSSFIADNEGAIGFQQGHVGAYIKDTSGNRFEIVQVLSSSQCVLDTRGLTPNFSSGMNLWGELSSGVGPSALGFLPAVTTAPVAGNRVNVGPSVKTAKFTLGLRTVAGLISDFYSVAGLNEGQDIGAKLYWHVNPEPASGDPTRLSLRIRSKMNPFIQITGRFLRPRDPVGPLQIDNYSAHPVLGFLEGEMDTTNLLTPSELVDLISAQSGLTAEVVTTEVSQGTLESVPLNSQVTAVGIDVGVQANDQVEITNGTKAGTYRITGTVTDTLFLEGANFIAKETYSYRIFREQVKISLTGAGPGTYLEVVSAPAELGLTAGKVYSAIPSFEAVDKLGNKLSFTGVVPGDLLRVVGQDEVVISDVQDTLLTLETGLPSNFVGVGFEIRSAAAKAYTAFNALMTTYTTSSNLLKKNKFDQGVDAIDVACTTAILPGQNFVASRNQAKRMVADLLSILSSTYLRQSEYTMTVTANVNNLSDTLSTYEAAAVTEIDDLIEAFLDRKYDRAAVLLRSGLFTDFYGTTEETGSYAGAVMAASRFVVKDLPRLSRTRFDFLKQRDLAKSSQTQSDGEQDFSDTENRPEDLDV